MGALKDIGVDPESASFKSAYENQVKETLRTGLKLNVPILDITFGFDFPDMSEIERENAANAFDNNLNDEE